MNIHQRDITEVAFYTGRTRETLHAIIISVDDIFQVEGFFYAILLSTKKMIIKIIQKSDISEVICTEISEGVLWTDIT